MVGSTAHGEENFSLYNIFNLGKEYLDSGEKILIFNDISFEIAQGETLAIVGASGSGKSSLLHILGSLANPSWGKVLFQGQDMGAMSQEQQARLRNTAIGFVFQFHHLLPEFSTLENVAMPAIIGGEHKAVAYDRASVALAQVGLSHRERHDVTLLSGGERQRAAIARAILQRPAVLLADEPTGNLDTKNGDRVADLLLELNAQHSMSLVVVTHNSALAGRMCRCFELKSGDLYEQPR